MKLPPYISDSPCVSQFHATHMDLACSWSLLDSLLDVYPKPVVGMRRVPGRERVPQGKNADGKGSL